MATNNSQNGWPSGLNIGFGAPLTAVPEQQPGTASDSNQYEHLDRSNVGSNTLKRNPKMELSRGDLLKLVTWFEGEIQARDIVISVLKSEQMKQTVNLGRYKPAVLSEPYIALLRDIFGDAALSKHPLNESELTMIAEQHYQVLEHLVIQQRFAHQHMMNIIKDAERKHRKVVEELEEEKGKHPRGSGSGDDVNYSFEIERTRLKQEIELERTARKKLEKEVKRQIELADEERARQKQIVLLLLAERKKIIVKYIEERKRSEDLAQILSEEKSRIDSMAEGLEEESKKSLQMEAELEKQVHVYEANRKTLTAKLAAKDLRCVELETELQKLKAECDSLKARTSLPCDSAAPMISSVAKVVQPTATVSSVPVSGPTTGIAQSVTPGQALRQTGAPPVLMTPPKNATAATVAAAAQGSPQTSTVRTPPKAAAYAGAPQMPPKKGTVVGRGMPPPIPPNKPVIPSKQTPSRRPDSAETEKKKPNLSGGAKEAVEPTSNAGGTNGGGGGGGRTGQGIEILGQELADFQQMFVTMATSNNT